MGLPRWGRYAIWITFIGVVFAPPGYLFLDAFLFTAGDESPNFQDLLLSSRQWGLLCSSLLLATGAALLASVIGVPYAFLCQKTDLPGRILFSGAYLIPLLIPPYMQAILWSRLLAGNGAVNRFMMDLFGLTAPPLNIHSLPGAMFVLAIAYFPFVTLLTLSGLKSLDWELERAALLQGGARRTVRHVTLPLVRPHIIAGTLFVFVFSIIDFGVPDILRINVYPVEIFIQFTALYDERAAIILGIPLLGVTVLVIFLLTRTMRDSAYVSFGAGSGSAVIYPLGSSRALAGLFCAAVLMISVIIPAGTLASLAGSLESYWNALSSSWEQIATSFLLAITAAALMTLFSLFLGMAIYQSQGAWKNLAQYITQIPFALPPVLLGIGMIKLWNHQAMDWLYGTSLIVILGYVAHFIPFTLRAVYSNIQQLNPRLIEAAALVRPAGVAFGGKVLLPLLRNGLISAFFIAFILAMGELGITLLVIPPGIATIPVKIYNFMHYGAEATVAALCLILLVLQLLMAGGLFYLSRRLDRGPG